MQRSKLVLNAEARALLIEGLLSELVPQDDVKGEAMFAGPVLTAGELESAISAQLDAEEAK